MLTGISFVERELRFLKRLEEVKIRSKLTTLGMLLKKILVRILLFLMNGIKAHLKTSADLANKVSASANSQTP